MNKEIEELVVQINDKITELQQMQNRLMQLISSNRHEDIQNMTDDDIQDMSTDVELGSEGREYLVKHFLRRLMKNLLKLRFSTRMDCYFGWVGVVCECREKLRGMLFGDPKLTEFANRVVDQEYTFAYYDQMKLLTITGWMNLKLEMKNLPKTNPWTLAELLNTPIDRLMSKIPRSADQDPYHLDKNVIPGVLRELDGYQMKYPSEYRMLF